MKSLALIIATIALTTVGCSNGYQGSGMAVNGAAGSNDAASVNSVDMQKIQSDVNDAQDSMQQAQDMLAQITNADGSIKIDIFTSSSTDFQTQFITDGLADKLGAIFDKIVAKVTSVKQVFSDARAKLTAASSQLDPSNPADQAQLAQITIMMSQLDSAENTFDTSLHMLASKIDLINNGFDALVSGANSICPIPFVCGGVAWLLLEPIQVKVQTFQAQLMSL